MLLYHWIELSWTGIAYCSIICCWCLWKIWNAVKNDDDDDEKDTMVQYIQKVKTTYMRTHLFIVKQSAHFYFISILGKCYSSIFITEQKGIACGTWKYQFTKKCSRFCVLGSLKVWLYFPTHYQAGSQLFILFWIFEPKIISLMFISLTVVNPLPS